MSDCKDCVCFAVCDVKHKEPVDKTISLADECLYFLPEANQSQSNLRKQIEGMRFEYFNNFLTESEIDIRNETIDDILKLIED